ncbi:ATP-binding protein [Mariniflexile sp. AS56]|uniref:PAS domain-containing sensor histidine kinase n=1 Tax=Mariniflexile sp. AS56 TaxID=3063957 RepID=UPI0026EC1F95|nr:ATP-binding protein [Mariniflexile sp. AS56]MDO7173779.1 ATP-binding protein [Mariniflexile sp. AS56]
MEEIINILREELSQKEDRIKTISVDYKNVYDNSPEMFVSIDPETALIKDCNKTLTVRTGYHQSEIIGKPIFFIYHEDCIPRVKKAFQTFLSTGSVKNEELELRKKNGEKITVLLNVKAVRDKYGRVLYSNSSWTDITELKQLRQEVEENYIQIDKSNKELEKRVKERTNELELKNKELSQFVYIASHDLQEPLRTIHSFSGLLKEEFENNLSDEANIYLNFISDASTRMSELVKGLLDYGLIGQNKKKTIFKCEQLIQDIQADLYIKIKESNTTLIINNLPEITGYKTEVRLLFQNLICNAIKFRKENSPAEIEVSVKRRKHKWEFSVKDNGIGIAEENTHRIFGIFKRLHNRDVYEGAGIGLSHCKKIVELHGGKIWVDSKINEGSTFHFTIPQI